MTVQTLRELLAERPFQPFQLAMTSEPTYDVRHPEIAWLTWTTILVGVDIAEDHVPSEFKIGSLLHVTSVEPLAASTSGRSPDSP